MTLQAQLAPHLQSIETLLLDICLCAQPDTPDTGTTRLRELSALHFATGGKRLRGTLPSAIVSEAMGPIRAAQILGACVEVIHNGTLVHDDIQDGDVLRRGEPTLWTVCGVAQAINIGDAMLVSPPLYLLQSTEFNEAHRAEIATMLSAAAIETIRGQVADVDLRDDELPTLAQATAIARAKTVPLFSCVFEGAVTLLEGSPAERAAAKRLADAVGLAFQVRDDLLDMLGTKGRGEAGSDLREGKPTYPILLALERGPKEEGSALRSMLLEAAAGRVPSATEIPNWLQWIRAHGGVERAETKLKEALNEARFEAGRAFPRGGAATVLALCDRLADLDG